MIFRALRQLEPDDEICINYNGDPSDKTALITVV